MYSDPPPVEMPKAETVMPSLKELSASALGTEPRNKVATGTMYPGVEYHDFANPVQARVTFRTPNSILKSSGKEMGKRSRPKSSRKRPSHTSRPEESNTNTLGTTQLSSRPPFKSSELADQRHIPDDKIARPSPPPSDPLLLSDDSRAMPTPKRQKRSASWNSPILEKQPSDADVYEFWDASKTTTAMNFDVQKEASPQQLPLPLFPTFYHRYYTWDLRNPNMGAIAQYRWPLTPSVSGHLCSLFPDCVFFIRHMGNPNYYAEFPIDAGCDWAMSKLNGSSRDIYEDIFAILVLCHVWWTRYHYNFLIKINLLDDGYHIQEGAQWLMQVSGALDCILRLAWEDHVTPEDFQNLYCFRTWLVEHTGMASSLKLPTNTLPHEEHIRYSLRIVKVWKILRVQLTSFRRPEGGVTSAAISEVVAHVAT